MKISNISSDELEFDVKEVKRSLVIENDFLVKLVDTIPAKMYFDSEIQEKITADKHLTMDKAVEGNFMTDVVFNVFVFMKDYYIFFTEIKVFHLELAQFLFSKVVDFNLCRPKRSVFSVYFSPNPVINTG